MGRNLRGRRALFGRPPTAARGLGHPYMPRFYFDIDDGELATRDDRGVEFDGAEAAAHAAVEVLPDLARDTLPDGRDRRAFVVEVRDGGGRRLFRATLAFAAERIG